MTDPTPHPLGRAEVEALLGAWAADALDAGERAAVDAALADHPDLAAEARALREAVADLAGPAEASPAADPATADLVAAALAARPAGRDAGLPAEDVATTAEAYADQVAALGRVLDEVPDDGWDRPVAAYPWTVRELVGHLVAVERYSASFLDLAEVTDLTDEADHLAMSVPVIAGLADRPAAEVVAEWRRLAEANAAHVLALDAAALDRPMPLHGIPFRVTTAIVARAFELWTHADDIRRALGLPLEAPPPTVVHRMATESVASLPAAVFTLDRLPDPGVAHVVLTGPGGGTWTVGIAGADPDGREPDVTLVTDVVDYCRVASSRITPDELTMTVEGDRALALDLLTAASFVAM